MKYIGPHVSINGGVQNAPLNAKKVGATTFGLFTKNQRQWFVKPYDTFTIDEFKKNMEKCGYKSEYVLAHDSYLINIGNPDKEKRKKSIDALIDELNRCNQLGLKMLNIHPGSHLGAISEEECLKVIAESINIALDKTDNVTIVLETTAGQGSNVGYRFEHLAEIIERVENKNRIGCCFDTCHAFAAGYDIRTKEAYNETMKKFDNIIGFSYLRGLHLNDSKSKLGSHIDRHHSIGEGEIGVKPFSFFMQDPRFDNLPLILETIDEEKWPAEVKLLSDMAKKNKGK